MEIDAMTIRGLDRDTVRRLSHRSNARGLRQLAAHLTALTATGLLVFASRGSAWIVPAMLAHGVVLSFLFCTLHETTHRTAFASRNLNAVVGWICGALLLLPPEYFRLFHFAHHRNTQDPARDPELAQPCPASVASYWWRASGIPNWTKRLTVTLGHALTGRVREPFVSAGNRAAIVREARTLWACYLAVLGVSLLLRRADALIYWIIPGLLGQPALRLFLLSEHAGCPMTDDMFANTRTTYTNGAMRLLSWQMSFHVEHHLFPSVPFHALAQVNALVRDRIVVSAPGYLALHRDLLRRLRASETARREERVG